MKTNVTKKALLSSALSLVLCFTMLLGTTFAWFTDSVTSANNIIQSGNLDIELYYQTQGQTDWTKVTDTTNVFAQDALWEPGHTEVVKLKVVNEGSLALKYTLGVNVANEVGSVNANGEMFKLSEYIKFGIVDGASNYANRDDAIAAVDATATAVQKSYTSGVIALDAKNDTDTDEKVVTMVVYMPTTVGNEANAKAGAPVPTIHLGINLFATQQTAESDSFDNQYDKDAGFNQGKTNVGPDKLNVLSGGNATYDDATKTYNIPVETVALGGYNATQGGRYYAGYTVNVAGYGENATVSFEKNGTTVFWKLADEERDGFINNGIHQQWTSVGIARAYHYDIDGDGVTDFTVYNDASNAKVEVANAEELKTVLARESDGVAFLLKAGTYEGLSFTNPAGFKAKNVTLVGENGTVVAGFSVNGWSATDNIVIDGLNFRNITFTSGILLSTKSMANVTVEDCVFQNDAVVHQNDKTEKLTGLTIKNCFFYGDKNGNSTAIMLENTENLTVTGCTFSNIDFNVLQAGIISGTVLFDNNTVNGTGDRVFRFVTVNADITISNNTITSEGDADGELAKASSACQIALSGNTWNGMTDAEVLASGKLINITAK